MSLMHLSKMASVLISLNKVYTANKNISQQNGFSNQNPVENPGGVGGTESRLQYEQIFLVPQKHSRVSLYFLTKRKSKLNFHLLLFVCFVRAKLMKCSEAAINNLCLFTHGSLHHPDRSTVFRNEMKKGNLGFSALC